MQSVIAKPGMLINYWNVYGAEITLCSHLINCVLLSIVPALCYLCSDQGSATLDYVVIKGWQH